MTLQENIREIRKAKGMTQEALAEVMGVSTASVSKWETGQSAPEIPMLAALADYFEVSVDTLLGHRVNADRRKAMLEELEALGDRGEFEAVKVLAQKLLRNYPNDYEVVDRVASAYYRIDIVADDDSAMAYSTELVHRLFKLAEDPSGTKRFELLSRLGNQYELLHDWEKARKYYEEGNVAGKNDQALARLLANEGKNTEAADAITRVFADSLCNLVTDIMIIQQVWRDLGELEKARAALQWGVGALESAGSSLAEKYVSLLVVMYLQLAGLVEELGEEDQAREYARKAVELTSGAKASASPDFLTDNVKELLVSEKIKTPEFVRELVEPISAEREKEA